MADPRVNDNADDLGFSWGKSRSKGGKKKEVQFYESFTYDGVEYHLYDSVYLFKEGEVEPYIGKLIKIWEHSKKTKKVKVLWFFKPSEISYYLRGENVLENELFLASGEGVGLANVNPLEAIAGKCNVVCLSKDERNRQPSAEELEKADYVFYRTFNVESFIISDKLGEKIAATEVKFLLNKDQLPLVSSECTPRKDEVTEPDAKNEALLLVKDDVDTNVVGEKLKHHASHNHGDGVLDSGKVASHATEQVIVSGKKTGSRSPDYDLTNLDKVIESAVNIGLSKNKTALKSESGLTDAKEKKKNEGQKLVDSGTNSAEGLTPLAASNDKRKSDLAKDVIRSVIAGGVNTRDDHGSMEERPSKKLKPDATLKSESGVTDAKEKKKNGGQKLVDSGTNSAKGLTPLAASNDKRKSDLAKDLNRSVAVAGGVNSRDDHDAMEDRPSKTLKLDGAAAKSDDKGKNGPQKSPITSYATNKASRPALVSTAENKDVGKLANVGTSNDLSKNLNSKRASFGSADAETSVRGNLGKESAGKLSKEFAGKNSSISKKLDREGAEDKSNIRPPKSSMKQFKNEEIEVYGHVKEVTQRPKTGKSHWFGAEHWDDSLKAAQNQGTLVFLQNLDPAYNSSEVENIVWHAFGESCTAKMVQKTAISSPHSGAAFVIFKSRETAKRISQKLDNDCLILTNGRPLVGNLWVSSLEGNQSSFPGHLVIDKLKYQLQREAKAVSTSHSSQSNTLEYEMAIDWRLLQERADLWWKLLYKQQEKELRKAKASFKSKLAMT